MSEIAPLLVIACGNPARGDDAAGPLLAERLSDWLQQSGLPSVEVLVDYQLNIEHILDLVGRRRVLFVDALARPFSADFRCERLQPRRDASHSSHACSPHGLLQLFEQLRGEAAPSAELLAIPGERFALGEPLSPHTARRLEHAWAYLQQWCLAHA